MGADMLEGGLKLHNLFWHIPCGLQATNNNTHAHTHIQNRPQRQLKLQPPWVVCCGLTYGFDFCLTVAKQQRACLNWHPLQLNVPSTYFSCSTCHLAPALLLSLLLSICVRFWAIFGIHRSTHSTQMRMTHFTHAVCHAQSNICLCEARKGLPRRYALFKSLSMNIH